MPDNRDRIVTIVRWQWLWVVSVLAVLAVTESASAFPITKIAFSGNRRVTSQELLTALSQAVPSPLNRDYASHAEILLELQHAGDIVKGIYTREGYVFATVDSFQLGLLVPTDSAQGYYVTFFLSEGARYVVGSITLRGNLQFSTDDLLSRFSTVVGDPLHEAELHADLTSILMLYERAGYPFATVAIASLEPDTNRSADSAEGKLDVQLRIDEGRKARIGKIVVIGNTSTNATVITRELGLKTGEFYNAEEVDEARARVERLGFFSSVAEPELYLENDSVAGENSSLVALIIRVKEANTTAIDGVLGYNPPRVTTESGYLSGLVDLSFRNISGTGRNASLNYDRQTRETQVLEVHYLEPWLFGYPLNIEAGFAQRQQDTTYTNTSISGDLTLGVTADLSLVGTLRLDRVVPTDLPELPFTVYDSKTLTTGLSVTTDSRDNSIAPRSGVLGVLGASYGVKSIYGPGRFIDPSTPTSIGLRSLLLDAVGYHTIFASRFVGVIGLHARSITPFGGQLDDADLFRVGGIYTIRGYRESELLASRYAYSNLELRLMTGPSSFLFLFSDDGYLWEQSSRPDSILAGSSAGSFADDRSSAEQVFYPVSYGFGAQIESPLGILSISIGLAKGEPLEQAKLHFGLIKQF